MTLPSRKSLPVLALLLSMHCMASDYEVTTKNYPLFLELVINQWRTGKLIPVKVRDQKLFIEIQSLTNSGITINQLKSGVDTANQSWVDINTLSDINSFYDAGNQQLKLQVSPKLLPHQDLDFIDTRGRFDPPQRSSGFLFNYDIYGSDSTITGTSLSTFSEFRFFSPVGNFLSSGVYRKTATSQGYVRYSSQWIYSSYDDLLNIRLGDIISGSPTWGRSIRLGGIQFSKNFDLKPDLITYPIPEFQGEAALPSALEVLINDAINYRSEILPGTYSLNTLPYINGAGEATVITTDHLGRQKFSTVNFYVAEQLLKPGLLDYSFSVGHRRIGFGVDSFNYDHNLATSGSVRYGVNNFLTVETHGEFIADFQNWGFGILGRIGNAGIVELSRRTSNYHSIRGLQTSMGYRYNSGRFSLSTRLVKRNSNYRDLGTIDVNSHLNLREGYVSSSFNLHKAGTLSLGYIFSKDREREKNRFANLTYSLNIARKVNMRISGNKSLSSEDDMSIQVTLSIPLGSTGTITSGYRRDSTGDSGREWRWGRAAPRRGGVGWQVGYADGDLDQHQARIDWHNHYSRLSTGFYGDNHNRTHFVEATGSLASMQGQWFASRPIHDAFAVVNTSGFANVPVTLSNQIIGETNKDGYLLVTDLVSLGRNKLTIDVMKLPINARYHETEQWITPEESGGVALTFNIERINPATFKAIDSNGKPLPVGTTGRHLETGQSVIVGWDGIVYLESLRQRNHLSFDIDDEVCEIFFSHSQTSDGVLFLGTLVCKPVANGHLP